MFLVVTREGGWLFSGEIVLVESSCYPIFLLLLRFGYLDVAVFPLKLMYFGLHGILSCRLNISGFARFGCGVCWRESSASRETLFGRCWLRNKT